MVPGPLSPEQIAWLDDLRTLLIAGWLTLAVWFGVTLARERPDVPKPKTLNPYYCRDHGEPEDLCRDKHDKG